MLGVRVPLPLRSLKQGVAGGCRCGIRSRVALWEWGIGTSENKSAHAPKKMTNPVSKIRQFYKETVVELKKASWPTRSELYSYILVVFVAIGLLGIFVSSADFAIYNVVDLLTWLVKGGK